MADTELQMAVAKLARLGATRSTIEWFTGSFDDYPDDGLQDVYEAAVVESTIDLTRERTYVATGAVTVGQDANENREADLDPDALVDEGWRQAGNWLGFDGTPERVALSAMVRQDGGTAAAREQRAAPQIRIERSNDGGDTWPWSTVLSATGYIRDTTGHHQSSNTIAQIDRTPGTRPIYRLVFSEGSTERDTCEVVEGVLDAEALVLDKLTLFKI